jgi:phosphoribosylglycinamide formyltransferase 1
MKKKIVVLASGIGTNFVAIREYIRKKKINAEIVALMSDNPTSNALLVALSFGIEPVSLTMEKGVSRDELNKTLDEKLSLYTPDLVVTAGYMKILPDFIVNKYENKIINIHPSLLPSFKGLGGIQQAWEYGVKVTGCTTHFVDTSLDGGKIILQTVIKIKEGMSLTELTAKVHKEEHKILPKTVQYFIEDRIIINGRQIQIQE